MVQMFRPGAGFDVGGERPSKAEAEAAARTLLRWAGRRRRPRSARPTSPRCWPAPARPIRTSTAATRATSSPTRPTATTLPDLQNGPESLIKGARAGIQHVGISNFRLPVRFRTRDGRRGAARDLGHRLGLARGRPQGHQHEPHHAVVLQARRDAVLVRGDRRGARQLPRRPRQLRRADHDALPLPDAEALAPQRARGLAVLRRGARDGEDRRGDPARGAPRLRLLLDLPVLARAVRARAAHPQPDRDAALAALGGAGVGRAGRRRRCSGSRTSSISATPRSRPRRR